MTFLRLFSAVLAALWVRDELRGFKTYVRRHNAKCKREAQEMNRLMNAAGDRGDVKAAKMYAEQYQFWAEEHPYKFLAWFSSLWS